MKSLLVMVVMLFVCASYAAKTDLRIQLQEVSNKYELPSVVGVALKNGSIVANEAIGVRKLGNQTKTSANDTFHLGSLTKSMTAMLVGMMVEEGKLLWSTELSEIYPDIHPDYKGVTIGMLLSHRAGVTSDLMKVDGGKLWARLWDRKVSPSVGRGLIVSEVLNSKPERVPGSKFSYSNAGYVIIGAIVEQVSGQSWEKLMRRRIFAPLNMASCGFGAPGKANAPVPDQPWGHRDLGDKVRPVAPGRWADNPRAMGPSGGVHCSLPDYLKFVQANIDGYGGKDNLVNARIYRKLHTAYPGQTYTYGGWHKIKRPWAGGYVLSHSGSNTYNYVNAWILLKNKSAMVAATNYGGAKAFKATDEVINSLIDVVK